jgi:hypothetical protein
MLAYSARQLIKPSGLPEQGRIMNHTTKVFTRTGVLLFFVIFVLAGCPATGIEKERSEAFKQYETIIRWSEWDAAADFISPEYQEEHPITRLELDRLRLFRVTAYTLRSTGVYDEGMTARQTVEIKMFNKHQSIERVIIDEQEWRYNEDAERWMLHSGLPDPTKRY